MSKIEKSIVTPKWLEIKEMYEQGTNGSSKYGTNFKIGGELDELTRDFLDMIADITEDCGYDFTVEGVHLNLWKERIWAVIENAGLLQDIAWKTDLEEEEIVDTWFNDNEEYEVDLDNLEYQAYES